MALPLLAELADVEDRLGRDLEVSEQRRADALLRDASIVVRNYTRREFTLGRTTSRHRPRGDKVLLPLRPVVQIHSVKSVIAFGQQQSVTIMPFWTWVAGHEVHLGEPTLVINGPTFEWSDRNVWAEVDYSHGFASIPEDIVSVVANLVVRNLTVPHGGLVDMETAGPYNVRYSGFTSQGPLGLSEADRVVLNRYRSTVTHTVELRG